MKVERQRDAFRVGVAALVLALVTAVYFGSLAGDFLNWDDMVYVLENPQLEKPLPEAAGAIVTTFYFHNYTPLPRLAHLVQWKLAGRDALLFRLTNLVLHAVACCLLFLVVSEWLGDRLVAAVTAVLFAVHPANVESVAWIAETNTLLAAVFAFGAILAWLRSDEEGGSFAAVVLFALALLSKSTVLGLPALLLLLDVSRRRRISVRRYVPVAVVALVFGVVQVLAASEGEGIKPLHGGSLPSHAATVLAALPRYLLGAVWPGGHAPHHHFPPVTSIADARLWVAVGLLALGAWACLRSWRGERRLLVAAPWFVLALLTVLVVPIPIVLADRFLYAAMPFLLAVAVAALLGLRGRLVWPGRAAAAAVVVAMALSAADYQGAWRSSTALWERNVASYPADRLSWEFLGALRMRAFDHEGAVAAFRRVTELDPDYRYGWERLAIAEGVGGSMETSEEIFARLIEEDPAEPTLWLNLAGLRARSGDRAGARRAIEDGLRHCPGDPRLAEAAAAVGAHERRQ